MADVTIVDAPPPAPPPAPTSTITPSTMAPPAEPAKPVKPGSARERMFKDLRSKAIDPNAPPAEPTPKPATAPREPEPTPEPAGDPNNPPEPQPEPEPKPGDPPTDPKNKNGKTNPWKLIDQYKGQVGKLQAEIASLKERVTPDNDRESFTKRITEAETRAKALEDEIRHVNYEKSAEFKTKYVKPYEAAWTKAMAELSEITITDPGTNQPRAVASEDLLNLVNLPLGQARALANQVFGDFADDVMAHRKEIRNLFDARNTALAEAKENGAKREKEQREQYESVTKQITESVRKTWETENQTALKDEKYGRYFAPVEGDEEGNQRLGKGYQLVDRAFSDPAPNDPRLTADQRREIIRRHAAVRNRAAAFGRLSLWNNKLTEENAALKKELSEYKQSTPSPSTETRPPNGVQGGSARDRVFSALRKIAKPA